MIQEMTKLRIIGPKRLLSLVVEELYNQNVLHIVESGQEGLPSAVPLQTAEEISESLIKARAIANQLAIPLISAKFPDYAVSKTITEINLLVDKVNTITAGIKNATDKINWYEEKLFILHILEKLDIEPSDITNYLYLDYFIGYIKNSEMFQATLKQKTTRFMIKSSSINKKELVALFIDKKNSDVARTLLSQQEFSPINLSGLQLEKKRVVLKKEYNEQLATANETLQNLEIELSDIKKQYSKRLPSLELQLSQELQKAQVPLQFSQTANTFVIWGYVPIKSKQKITNALMQVTKKKIHIEEYHIHEHDQAPIQLSNPKQVSSFQFFLNLYSLPSYHEIDPSWILFITFPLLFGFMLGDIGYGLVTLILFFILKIKMPSISKFLNILIYSSIASIVFGAVFAEFFGIELYHPLINRNPEHQLFTLIIASIVIGIIHVNFGLIVGFINEYKSHGFKQAFMEKFGWILLQIAIAVLALSYFRVLPILPIVGYILFAILLAAAVFILYKGEGARGIVEIPSIFGNILSYVRLMAIGLSSVGLAFVVNLLAGQMFNAGGFAIIAGVLILVIGHAINIGLGILGGFLHSLRLHYVELFSKFYKGGGVPYKPFGALRDDQ